VAIDSRERRVCDGSRREEKRRGEERRGDEREARRESRGGQRDPAEWIRVGFAEAAD
jgi:hypothetical protein